MINLIVDFQAGSDVCHYVSVMYRFLTFLKRHNFNGNTLKKCEVINKDLYYFNDSLKIVRKYVNIKCVLMLKIPVRK